MNIDELIGFTLRDHWDKLPAEERHELLAFFWLYMDTPSYERVRAVLKLEPEAQTVGFGNYVTALIKTFGKFRRPSPINRLSLP